MKDMYEFSVQTVMYLSLHNNCSVQTDHADWLFTSSKGTLYAFKSRYKACALILQYSDA
jgi:hypothetical protein